MKRPTPYPTLDTKPHPSRAPRDWGRLFYCLAFFGAGIAVGAVGGVEYTTRTLAPSIAAYDSAYAVMMADVEAALVACNETRDFLLNERR